MYICTIYGITTQTCTKISSARLAGTDVTLSIQVNTHLHIILSEWQLGHLKYSLQILLAIKTS